MINRKTQVDYKFEKIVDNLKKHQRNIPQKLKRS